MRADALKAAILLAHKKGFRKVRIACTTKESSDVCYLRAEDPTPLGCGPAPVRPFSVVILAAGEHPRYLLGGRQMDVSLREITRRLRDASESLGADNLSLAFSMRIHDRATVQQMVDFIAAANEAGCKRITVVETFATEPDKLSAEQLKIIVLDSLVDTDSEKSTDPAPPTDE